MSERVFIGVDPGLSGAIARIGGGTATVEPMPIMSGSGRDQYDLAGIISLLVCFDAPACLAVIEKLQPMPLAQGGTIANYNRGRALAVVEMACTALRIPYELVAPRTWQKAMHAGTSGEDLKQRSVVAAKRLFPGVSLKRTARSRKDCDGMAEALLLADWGRRTRAAQEVSA